MSKVEKKSLPEKKSTSNLNSKEIEEKFELMISEFNSMKNDMSESLAIWDTNMEVLSNQLKKQMELNNEISQNNYRQLLTLERKILKENVELRERLSRIEKEVFSK